MSLALRVLSTRVDITTRDTGLVSISAFSTDPRLAKDLAQFFLNYLQKKVSQNTNYKLQALTAVIADTKTELSHVDNQLKNFRKEYHVYDGAVQFANELSTYQRISESLVGVDGKLAGTGALAGGSGTLNAQLEFLNTKAGLEEQRLVLQREVNRFEKRRDLMPDLMRSYTDMLRAQKALEAKLEFYLEKAELARLEKETQELQPFQVVDQPVEADEPMRRYLILKGLASAAIAVVIAFICCQPMVTGFAKRGGTC